MDDLLQERSVSAQGGLAAWGQQSYFVDVPGTASAKALSVISFEATERMGEPYKITIELAHADELPRNDFLGRDASFTIAPADNLLDGVSEAPARIFRGCVTSFTHTKTTADFHSYRVVIEAHIARLKLTRASRIYQQQSAPQIVEAILRRHGFEGSQFAFKLRRTYPVHAFRFQYQLADWAYIHLLMEQEGLYSYIVPGKHGDVVVFADDIDHYIYQPELRVPYRETAGLEASGTEAVFTLQTHAQTVPQSFRVADYNPAQAWERFNAEANVASNDSTTYGQPYVYGTHHLDQDDAQWEAQLRHEAAIAWQLTFEGDSNVLALCPARILRLDSNPPEAPNGQVIIAVTHSGARDQPYRNTYQAIPSDRRFRLKLEEDSWPTIPGTLSARVTSPGKYKYAFITKDGHYTVRFDCDFDTWNPGGESVPLRLAKPFAGGLQTGFHFPALDGTEAVIAFRDGNPNKPYIAAFHHTSQQTDLVTNQDRWLSRNVIRTQSNNKLRMEDYEGEEGVKLSTDHSGKSQLNLGYLVDSNKKQRGEGAELRTSGWAALRGGKGVFISADDQPNAQGQQLAMDAAVRELEQRLVEVQALVDATKSAQAIAAEVDEQRALLYDTLNGLKQAGLLVSAPAGIGIVSGNHLQLSAAKNLIVATGGSADIGVLKRFTVAAGEAVSLFAAKLGIKFIAAKGKVDVQAQSDALDLTALKDITITSTAERLVISAKQEVWIGAGGSYIRIDGNRIESGTPGDIIEKCAWWGTQGPASIPMPAELKNGLPATPLLLSLAASPASKNYVPAGMPYQLFADGALVKQGVLDATGQVPVDHRTPTQAYRLELANGVVHHFPMAEAYRGNVLNGELANQGFHYHEAMPSSAGEASDRAVHRQDYHDLLHPDAED
jgi:type VI secretion system secreted protein VgrG